MQKVQDFAKIVGVEMPDGLKELNKLPDNRGNWRTAVRIVVEFATADNMTEKQRALYERATDEQKRIMQANKVRLQYGGLFNAENIIPNFTTPENGYNDAQLSQVLAKVKEIFANIGNTAIFTLYEFNVNELKEDITAVYTQDGVKLTSRSRLFFDFFDDDEAAKRMLTASLLQRIDDGELLETNPNERIPTSAPAFNI